MKRKKRLAALLCTVFLLCTLLPTQGSAISTVYLLSINDKICDLPGGALPVPVNGSIYVPYSVFDNAATGIDLGVYYGLSQDSGPVLTLYSRSDYLTFTVNTGECVDGQGNVYDAPAVYRGGYIYVPAADVCGFFGLKLSVLPTGDRGTLVRVTNGDATMEDTSFLSYAVQAMTTRYNEIVQSQLPPAPTPPPALPPPPPPPPVPAFTPYPTAAPTPKPEATPRPSPRPPVPTPSPTPTPLPTPMVDKDGNLRYDHIRVLLAVDASRAPEDLLSQLPPSSPRLLLLFTPSSLTRQSALIRQAVSLGHSIGFLVEGTPEEVLMELDECNQLLTHIARIRTRIAAPILPDREDDPEDTERPEDPLLTALTGAGWHCWLPNVSGSSVYGLVSQLKLTPGVGRVNAPASPAQLSQLIRELQRLHFTLRQPLETEL